MCGINGIIFSTSKPKDKLSSIINGMNDTIVHRGPDDYGTYSDTNENYSIAMGMRRLSIIDLNSGNQPIFSDDGQIVIVYNGEIYNYLELRQDLQKKNIDFKTTSDTEVILKLYELEGHTAFCRLDGMFAFSIYDKRIDKVIFARDFFGEKPFYFTKAKDYFIWGSELKSITRFLDRKPDIDRDALNLYFRLTYIPAPFTIYEGIHKLNPGHYMVYDLQSHNYQIFDIEKQTTNEHNIKDDFKSAKKKVRQMVYDSVESRSIADVPLGTFLSGGVDSSVVSLCLAQSKTTPIDTFSIGFEKKSYDETDKSRAVAKLIGSKHHEFIIGEKDLAANVESILLNFDEPFADSSCLPTYMVSNKTRDFVKVALTGDGGDEVFGGYNKYYMGALNKNYTQIVPKRIHNTLKSLINTLLKDSTDKRGYRFLMRRLVNSINYDGQYYWDILSLGFSKSDLNKALLKEKQVPDIFESFKREMGIKSPNSLTDFRKIDKRISLEGDMLVKVDRTSMLNSLECRAPFLNKKIWHYANTLPEKYLLKGWDKKYILKEAFKDQFEKDFLDKSKSGFGVPVGDWLRSSLRKELKHYVDDEKLLKQQIFDLSNIKKLVKDHLSGKQDNTFMVWSFYCFQKWYFNNYEAIH